MVRGRDDKGVGTIHQCFEKGWQAGIHITQGGGVTLQVVFLFAIDIGTVGLVNRADVEIEENPFASRDVSESLLHEADLVLGGVGIGDSQVFGPMRLGKQVGQHPAQGGLSIEKAHSADADRVIVRIARNPR